MAACDHVISARVSGPGPKRQGRCSVDREPLSVTRGSGRFELSRRLAARPGEARAPPAGPDCPAPVISLRPNYISAKADVAVKVHTGALTLFLCSRRSFPAVHEGTPPASMLSGTHGGPGPADNPHGGPADRLNRSGSTPSRPVSAVVQGQDERITRDPAYTTYGWKCAPATKEKRGLA